MEKYIEIIVSGLGWEILSGVVGFGIAAMIGFLFGIPQFRAMRKRLDVLEAEKAARPVPQDNGREGDTVDYVGACAIIDAYIDPVAHAMGSGARLAARRDIIDRFDKVTNARLGENEYNRPLLHQWIQSNAARFLIENRDKMS